MFFRILKRDLGRKKGINFILFIFMILATLFVASSIDNILAVSNATDYSMEKGKVPDEYIAAMESQSDKIENWLKKQDKKIVSDYSVNKTIMLSKGNIDSFAGKKGSKFEIKTSIMLTKQWNKHMLIFDENQKLAKIKDGEIGITETQLRDNKLKVGDTITLKYGDYKKKFKISTKILDPALGGDYVGMARYLLSDNDFDEIEKHTDSLCYNYGINTDNLKSFKSAFNKQAFNVIVNLDGEMFEFAYVISIISAAILIVVGICLIIISFLILRFTIVFTLQEDYKEIGIMKAIGIKNFGIKKLYLIKYLILVLAAAVIGCIISMPISNIMIKSVAKNIMMKNSTANIGINILCSIAVMIVVLLLCYLCTNKLKKFSAIEAIRNGETGERYKRKSIISLSKRKKMPTPLFMAVNDIFSNIKRYVVLLLTFAMGMIMIILSLNTISTFKSKEMIKSFAMDTKADFFVNPDSVSDGTSNYTKEGIKNNLDDIKKRLKDKGYDTDINTFEFMTLSMYTDDKDDVSQVFTIQPVNTDGSFMELLEGKTPKLRNEIAMSEMVMKELNVKIGDTVHLMINGKVKDMIICGKYQNYMQMGKSAFVSESFDVKDVVISGNWTYQVYVKNKVNKDNIVSKLNKAIPRYEFLTVDDTISTQLGSTESQLGSMKGLVVIIICIVNILITALMMKIFILGERGQIAMLRSVGFSLKQVRLWQVLRMGIVVLLAEILGIILSKPLNNIVLRPIFGMMGSTHMIIEVNPLQVYLIYPLLLLVVITVVAAISSASIKKLNIMEINNVE